MALSASGYLSRVCTIRRPSLCSGRIYRLRRACSSLGGRRGRYRCRRSVCPIRGLTSCSRPTKPSEVIRKLLRVRRNDLYAVYAGLAAL
jgi:hypothetical protein